jgi:hypothetical protein
MKAKHIASGVLVLVIGIGCSKKSEESKVEAEGEAKVLGEAKADGEASMKATLASLVPRLGGSLLALGKQHLELAIHENGLVSGLLFSADGNVVAEPKAKIEVELQAEGDAKPKVELTWDEKTARYTGNANAEATLVPKPVKVSAQLGGKTEKATLSEYALLPEPSFGGTVLSNGGFKTELIARPDGELQAFVTDSKGAQVKGSAKASLKANFGGKAAPDVKLAWDEPRACFVGKAHAGTRIEGQPLKLALEIDGQSHLGGLAQLAVTADAKHDGAVVIAGDLPVELAVNGDFVEAHVLDVNGEADAKGDFDVKLFAGADGDTELALKWYAPSACYRAKLEGKLDLDTTPLRVHLVRAGQLHAGAALSLKAVSGARRGADAQLAANADVGAELPDVKAKAELKGKAGLATAANAKAKAQADARARADANAKAAANLKAKANVVPPKVDVKKSVKASASSDSKGSAKAGLKAGFSLGTK